ncbi:MAG: hypothetical protein J6V44_17525 [Methanobrevibacter sp.]|nr:hypothetical protein [Methanobrevibacter sp.]
MERLEKAQSYNSEAVDLYKSDSLKQSLYKFIDALSLIETLPEDMTEEEKHLASKVYNNINHIFISVYDNHFGALSAKRALHYQKIANEIDSIIFPSVCLAMASSFTSETEADSVMLYLKMAEPYLDTINDIGRYIMAQHLLSTVYYNQGKFDSCFQVCRNMIAFKCRRGLEAKRDSMTLGIQMFHSPYMLQSKPYLLKVLEYETRYDIIGSIMLLLEKIYEYENNQDSVNFCRKYYGASIESKIKRDDNKDDLTKIYEIYAEKRDAKINELRELKKTKKKTSLILIAIVISMSVLYFIFRRNSIKLNKQSEHYNNIIADIEFKHSIVDGRIKKMNVELRKKEDIIKSKEIELDEMKQKIERIENSPNIPNIESYYKSDICRKIVNRKATDFSALTNEDFALLIQAADKHLNNITTRLKEKYPKINKEDLYYICLILLNTDENKLQYLINKNRKTIWYRLSKIRNMFELENNDDILIYIIENFIN